MERSKNEGRIMISFAMSSHACLQSEIGKRDKKLTTSERDGGMSFS